MRLFRNIALITSLVGSINCDPNIKVFKFPGTSEISANNVKPPVLSVNDAILNLANQLDISDDYDLEKLQNLDSLSVGQDKFVGGSTDDDETDRQKLVLIVQGASSEEFLKEESPIFEISPSHKDNSKDFQKFLSNLPNELNKDSNLLKLSESINIIESKSSTAYSQINSKLKHLWDNYFQISMKYNLKLENIWTDLKETFHLSQPAASSSRSSVDVINDESFINEMSQFKFLLEDAEFEADKIVANLKSFSTILKKTGQNSKTYQNSLNILSHLINQNLINDVNKRFESIIIVLPSIQDNFGFESKVTVQPLHKRQVSQREKRASAFASSSCYASEESCLISTSSCSNHGVCAKSGDCWSCSCAASYNKTTKSTTYWQGATCSKKDVSVEFNLFLWFTVFIGISTILGIKLLYNVGNEELPGVLSAATAAKRSNA